MRQVLEFRASQQLALTPQLVQAIKLLQLSAAELETEVERALGRNPFLERGDEQTTREPGTPAGDAPDAPREESHGDDAPAQGEGEPAMEYEASRTEWSGTTRERHGEATDFSDLRPAARTLHEHLLEQAFVSQLCPRDRALVATVVAALDDDGMLRQSLEEILPTLPESFGADLEELEVALRFVQSLEPAGVGARSLSECLTLQLAEMRPDTPGRALAMAIVADHLALLAAHDAASLSHVLGCDEAAIREANLLIRRLDPRPGLRFGSLEPGYVVADIIVRRAGRRWLAAVNPAVVPNIRVNRLYAQALQRERSDHAALAQHLQEARWLVRSVEQRFQTIQRVAQTIVDRQRLFLELGDAAMRPLTLREVAAELGLHPSTVSRVVANKYMETPRGLIGFKRFFSSRLENEDGATCSGTAVRAVIRELVAAENPQAPLSDVQITRLLGSRGIRVARRTVAKYRDALHIPPVEARRLAGAGPAAKVASSARPIAAVAAARRAAQRPAAAVTLATA